MDPLLIELPVPIETPRLFLKPPEEGQGAAMNEAIRDSADALRRWMPWAQELPSVGDSEANMRRAAARFRLREDLRFQIWHKDGTFLGGTGLHRFDWNVRRFEIGYWVRSSHTGQGLATELARALTVYAVDHLRARRMEIRCDDENRASQRVAEKLGYIQEGRLKHNALSADGQTLVSTLIYGLTDFSKLDRSGIRWPGMK